ncbi:MAG: hypothetical protein OXF30_00510 [Candidatus Saccharibacteria bacterium]|nr:hypothetical protein [Candidatus Saccharibacteria bacterium]
MLFANKSFNFKAKLIIILISIIVLLLGTGITIYANNNSKRYYKPISDADGNRLNRASYDSFLYPYDENPPANLEWYYIDEYDADGNRTKRKHYDAYGKLVKTQSY